MSRKIKEASVKVTKGLGNSLPVLVGIVLLIGLANTAIPKSLEK